MQTNCNIEIKGNTKYGYYSHSRLKIGQYKIIYI